MAVLSLLVSRVLEISTNPLEGPELSDEKRESSNALILNAVSKMTGLLKISLAPWLLTAEVFSAVQANPSITQLGICGSINPPSFPPFLQTSTSSSIQPRTLIFDLELRSSSNANVIQILSYLKRIGGVVERFALQANLVPSFLLDSTSLPSLRSLEISVAPAAVPNLTHLLSHVLDHLPSVTSLSRIVEHEDYEPFFLSSSNWIPLAGSNDVKFLEEWGKISFLGFKIVHELDTSALSHVQFGLNERINITRSMVLSLGDVVRSVVHL